MARRRFQAPKPKREGNWWYLLVWQDEFKNGRRSRKRKRLRLAPAHTPVREAQRLATEALQPMNQGLVSVGAATTFLDYVKGIYEPTDMPLLASTTQERTRSVLKNYLLPAFGDKPLRELTPYTIQQYLTGMASWNLEHETKDKIRDVLSAILRSAVQYGYLVKNPVENLKLPPSKKGKKVKPYVTPQEFELLLAEIPEPYASMVFVAGWTGLRVSEVLALRWENIHEASITVNERFSRGDFAEPKSDASNATIPVDKEVIQRIQNMKTMTIRMRAGRATREYPAVKSSAPHDLVFQSPVTGAPMRDNNVLTRHLKPAGRKVGLPYVNWQVLRRSFGTWLGMDGAPLKDAQALMRHSRASTTMDIYQQFVPESQVRTVDSLAKLRSLPKAS